MVILIDVYGVCVSWREDAFVNVMIAKEMGGGGGGVELKFGGI